MNTPVCNQHPDQKIKHSQPLSVPHMSPQCQILPWLDLFCQFWTLHKWNYDTHTHPTPNAHILITRIFEYLTSPGKRYFADVVKSRILKWGRLCWIIQVVPVYTQGPLKWKKEAKDVRVIQRKVIFCWWISTWKRVAMGHGIWAASRRWEQQGKRCLPGASRREQSLADN